VVDSAHDEAIAMANLLGTGDRQQLPHSPHALFEQIHHDCHQRTLLSH
jgi:hypothetical protein